MSLPVINIFKGDQIILQRPMKMVWMNSTQSELTVQLDGLADGDYEYVIDPLPGEGKRWKLQVRGGAVVLEV